jgi:3-oxoacyl-[acyl-carrier protein] reductase
VSRHGHHSAAHPWQNTIFRSPWDNGISPAQVAVFLASSLAGWVTGQTISVDGGQML